MVEEQLIRNFLIGLVVHTGKCGSGERTDQHRPDHMMSSQSIKSFGNFRIPDADAPTDNNKTKYGFGDLKVRLFWRNHTRELPRRIHLQTYCSLLQVGTMGQPGLNTLPPEVLLQIFALGRWKARSREPDYRNLKVKQIS